MSDLSPWSPSRNRWYGAGRFSLPALTLLIVVGPGSFESARAEAEGEPNTAAPSFLESVYCAVCHANSSRASAMRDGRDRGIAPYDLWCGTSMANASRDPFWRAVLSSEVASTPSQKALIEEKCTRCHAPMAGPAPQSPAGQVLAYLNDDDERSWLGLDGVSCTVCHQIQEAGLGTEASFTGHFKIGAQGPIFGPHADPFAMPMQRHTGYTPTLGKHVLRSALCATCHTLDTAALNQDGTATGHRLHEQSPYREWLVSNYNDEGGRIGPDSKSCQACHMPTTDVDGNPIRTRIAHNPGGRDFPFLRPRVPFGRHTFYGGNTFLARLLRENDEVLDMKAPRSALTERIDATQAFLRNSAAELTIGRIQHLGQRLQIPVAVKNLAGHKLPTAYPSRRVWIHVEVRDASDQLIFESGRYDSRGRLTDADGQPLASELTGGPTLPHYRRISSSKEVQVYQSIMADSDGRPAFTLLRGASYVKDNRLLPRGWQPDHPDAPSVAPVGTQQDDDFVGGQDTLVYEVPVTQKGPFSVQAWLHYQVVSARYADELFQFDTPDVRVFRAIFQATNNQPEMLATCKQWVPLKGQ